MLLGAPVIAAAQTILLACIATLASSFTSRTIAPFATTFDVYVYKCNIIICYISMCDMLVS